MTENAVLDREASLKELEIKRQQYYDEMRNEIKDEITRLRKKVFTYHHHHHHYYYYYYYYYHYYYYYLQG